MTACRRGKVPEFVDQLRTIRIRKKLSLSQLSNRLGYSNDVIMRWEHGENHTLHAMVDWCQALGVEIKIVDAIIDIPKFLPEKKLGLSLTNRTEIGHKKHSETMRARYAARLQKEDETRCNSCLIDWPLMF